MKKRAGKRVQLKRLRYQIKQAIDSRQDFFHLSQELEKREKDIRVENPHTHSYRLIPINIEPDYPDYRQINKTDPRYKVYKLRFLFGSED